MSLQQYNGSTVGIFFLGSKDMFKPFGSLGQSQQVYLKLHMRPVKCFGFKEIIVFQYQIVYESFNSYRGL